MAAELPSSDDEVQALLQSAVSSRASHIRKEAETISMANVRRLLESDLGLENSALDVHKKFIRQLVDEVLLNSGNAEGQNEAAGVLEEEEAPKRKRIKTGQKAREKRRSLGQEDQHENNHGDARKKKKRKEISKKELLNRVEDDDNIGGNRAELSEGENAEAPKEESQKVKIERYEEREELDENGNDFEVSEEDSDAYEQQKPKKAPPKNANVKPVQNMKLEHLKKVIKACGLTIPPQIYKRAKQQPEEKHDKFLMKEMQEILHRHGLSSDPSEKEIKAVKRKIAREKDLEGIDTTNILLEPRGRRATSQLFAPVYNPPPAEYDSEQDSDGDDNDEEDSENADCSDDEEKDFADGSENSD